MSTLAVAQPAAAIGPGSSGDNAPLYYLSLGDSLAAGVQPIGDPANLYRTDEGYADQLYAMAREWYPNLKLVKLGCPGETTATMIDGGICAYPHGSQLDEAVSFLHAHGRFVAFVSIDIGSNDFPCQTASRACRPAPPRSPRTFRRSSPRSVLPPGPRPRSSAPRSTTRSSPTG